MTSARWAWGMVLCLLGAGAFITATAEPLEVQTVEFDAPSVGRTMKYNIVLPEAYDEEPEKRYPVLYLLHGYTSNYILWGQMRVPEYASLYELIVVMPDVGNSWYINWAESEDGQKNAWEDFIIEDLIGHVDATYRTIAAREGRAINGLSMGGYGAIMLGLKHPDLFCSIGSHSGALEYARSARGRLESGEPPWGSRRTPSERENKAIGIPGFNSQADRHPKGTAFATVADCDRYDPFTLILEIPAEELPHIYIDCGTEDRLLGASQDFMNLLMENKIPFTYAQSQGGHAPVYWIREVARSMAVQYQVIQRSLSEVSD